MLDKLGTKWVEIDLDVLERNLRRIRKCVAPSGVIAVVKADAYGHGAVETARCAEKAGITMYAVSCLEEAVELRRAFFSRDILVFGSLPESQAIDMVNYELTPTVAAMPFARALSREAGRLKREVRIHVCVDTGDGRVGPFHADADAFVRAIGRLPHLKLTGLYSHFSTSDDDASFALEQKKRFDALVTRLRKSGINIPVLHMANSGGVLNVPGTFYDCVRTGLLMYGIYPCEKKAGYPKVDSVFSLKTKVTFVKSVPKGFTVSYGRRYVTKRATTIVTLPVGYADGFPRKFSNAGEVLIKGRRYPVVGAVCMDMIMVDAGPRSRIKPGDEAVLIGRQGKEELSVYEIAARLGTIPYEVICSVGKRVSRVYVRNGRAFAVKKMISEF